MKDSRKTKAQLIAEVEELRARLARLEQTPPEVGQELDIQRLAKHLEVLSEVTQTFAIKLTLREVGDRLLRIIRSVVPCDTFFLNSYYPETNLILSHCAYDVIDGQLQALETTDWPMPSASYLQPIFETRKPLRIHRKDPAKEATGHKLDGDSDRPSASLLFVPMISRDKVVGFLSVHTYEFDAYSDEDVQLVAAIARQAGPALEASLLMETIRGKEVAERLLSERLVALLEITSELAATETLDDLCLMAVEQGRERLGFDRIGLWFVNPDDPTHEFGTFGTSFEGETVDDHSTRIDVEPNSETAELLSGQRKMVYIVQEVVVRGGPDWRATQIVLPLFDGVRIIGTLRMDNLISHASVNHEHIELLRLFALALGMLLSRRRVEGSLIERNERLELLDNLARVTTGSLTVTEMCDRFLDMIRGLMICDAYVVGRYVPETGTAHTVSLYDTIDGEFRFVSPSGSVFNPAPPVLETLQTREPVLVFREAAERDAPDLLMFGSERLSLSLIYVALVVGDRPVGYVSVQSYEEQAFTESDASILATLCKRFAPAFEASLLTEEIQQRERNERHFSEKMVHLVEATNVLTTQQSLDDLCRCAVELGKSSLGFDRVGVWLITKEDSRMIVGTFGTDSEGRTRDERDLVEPLSDLTSAKPDNRQELVGVSLVTDVPLMDSGETIRENGRYARASMWDGEKDIGFISIDNAVTGKPVTRNDCEILSLFASALGHLIGRERVRNTLREQNEMLAILSEVGKVSTGSGNVHDLVENLLKILREAMSCDMFLLGRYVDNATQLLILECYDLDASGVFTSYGVLGKPFTPEGPFRYAFENRRPHVIFRDLPNQTLTGLFPAGNFSRPSASLAYLSLFVGDKPIGAMSIQSYTPRAFTDRDLDLMTAIAERIAPALDVCLLTEDLHERERTEHLFGEHLIRLIQVTADLNMEENLDDLCRHAVQFGHDRLGFERIGLWLVSEDDEEIVGTYGITTDGQIRDERVYRLPINDFKDAPAQRDMKIIIQKDIPLDEFGVVIQESGTRVWIWLWDGERKTGFLCMDNGITGNPVSQSTCEILSLYGNSLGHLIARDRARNQLKEQNTRLAILNEVAQVMAGSLTVDEMCDNLLGTLRRVFTVDCLVIERYLLASDELHPIRLYDTFGEEMHTVPVTAPPYGPTGPTFEALRTQKTRVIFREDPDQYVKGLTAFGENNRRSASLIFAPLFVGDRPVGIISIQSYTTHAYSEFQIDLFTSIAERVAPVFEATLLGEEVREREEKERLFGEQLVNLVEITNELATQNTFDDLCRRAVELALQRLVFDRVGIWFLASDGVNIMIGSFGTDEQRNVLDERAWRCDIIPESAIGQVLLSKLPLVIENRQSESNEGLPPLSHAISSMGDRDRVIGAVVIDDFFGRNGISPQQVELLRLFASTLGTLCSLKRAEEALGRSDEVYRTAIEKAAGVPYKLRFSDWTYEFIGSGVETILGVNLGEFSVTILNSMVREVVVTDPEGPFDVQEYAKEFRKGNRPIYRTDIRLVTPGGEEKWLTDIAVPLRDEKTGALTGTLGILQDITDRKRVEQQLREHNERLTILNDTAQAVLRSQSSAEMCDELVRILRSLIPCDALIIDAYNPTVNEIYTLALYDTIDGRFQSVENDDPSLEPSGSMLKVIQDQRTVLIHREEPKEESKAFTFFGDKSKPSASLLYAPMIAGDRVMGVLSVQSYTYNAYSQRDVDLFTAIAQQSGAALDAVLLAEQIKRREQDERQFGQQLTALVEVTNQLSATETMDDLCRNAIELALGRLQFDRMGLWFISDQDPNVVYGSFGVSEDGSIRDERGIRIALAPDSAMGKVISGRDSLVSYTSADLLSNQPETVGQVMVVVAAISDGRRIIGCLPTDNLLTNRPITDRQREVLRLYASSLGALVASRRAEESLRESESRFRGVSETTLSSVFMVQHEKFVYVNHATEILTGYTREELLNMNFWAFVHPDSQEMIRQRSYARRRGEPAPDRYECKIVTKDGRTKWIDEAVSVIELQGLPTVITVALNITDRKRSDEERESLRRLSQALTAPLSLREVGMLVAKESRSMFAYDAFWFDILDTTRNMLPGVYAEDTPLDGEVPIEVEVESRGLQGLYATTLLENKGNLLNIWEEPTDVVPGFGFSNRRSRSIVYVPICWQDKSLGIISVQSYTPGRYLEEDLKLLQSFADQCGGALYRVQTEERLRSASRLEATATLAGGVAHDFNNLMVVVLGNAELIKMELSDRLDAEPLVEDIISAAQRAGELAQQMLAFARGGKYRPKIMNLSDTISETLSFQQRVFPPGIRIDRRFSPQLWKVFADPIQMGQVVMNLCINAVEAIGESGEIVISTGNIEVGRAFPQNVTEVSPGTYAYLSIQDTGHGMTSEVMARIFEPFYTTKFQGRGLGLAAVYGIIKNHAGHITVRSEIGSGTEFTIYLPKAEADALSSAENEVGLPTGTETILLIDDEQYVLTVTRSILQRLGYTVMVARNGLEAIEMAREYEGDIHIAVLDIGMPIMGGGEAYPKLLRLRPHMKIIVCSGYDRKYTSDILGGAEVFAFIQKPFRANLLAPAIRAALDTPSM